MTANAIIHGGHGRRAYSTYCGLSASGQQIAIFPEHVTCPECRAVLGEYESRVSFTVPIPKEFQEKVERIAQEKGVSPAALLLRFIRAKLPEYLDLEEE